MLKCCARVYKCQEIFFIVYVSSIDQRAID